jgi:hypothetical protein
LVLKAPVAQAVSAAKTEPDLPVKPSGLLSSISFTPPAPAAPPPATGQPAEPSTPAPAAEQKPDLDWLLGQQVPIVFNPQVARIMGEVKMPQPTPKPTYTLPVQGTIFLDQDTSISSIVLDALPENLRLMGTWYGLIGLLLVTNLIALAIFTFISMPTWLGQQTLSAGVFAQAMGDNFQRAQAWYWLCLLFGLILALVVRGVPEGRRFLGIPNTFWGVAGLLILLLFMVPIYSQQLYPWVAPSLGGGKTIPVQLVADSASAQTLAQLVPMESDAPAKTVKVDLLDENDKAFFLLVPGLSSAQVYAVRIDKDLVKGVLFFLR